MTSRCSIKLHILIDDNIDFFDFEIDTTSQGQSINEFILANHKLQGVSWQNEIFKMEKRYKIN